MPALSAYANTENTALIILKQKGYQYWYDEKMELYCCEKGGWDFAADGATELLGVVAFFEYHRPKECKEYWWKIDEPWLIEDIPKKPKDYTPVWRKDA